MARRGQELTVAAVRTLSPRLRGITLEGPTLVGASFSPGDKVKLDVGGGRMRSYTPAWCDAARGALEVVAVVHGQGPGSRWADGVGPGDRTTVFGPVPSLSGPTGRETWAWFLGDETTVGLYRALTDALATTTVVDGAIELDAADASALDALGLPLRAANRTRRHGEALMQWLEAVSVPRGPGAVWVSGHAGAVEAIERRLVAEGLTVHAKPYWNRKKDRLRALVPFA